MVDQFWKYVQSEWLPFDESEVGFYYEPSWEDAVRLWGDSLSDGHARIRLKFIVENNGLKSIDIDYLGWCWYAAIVDSQVEDCYVHQAITGPLCTSARECLPRVELPVRLAAGEQRVFYATVLHEMPWTNYSEVFFGSCKDSISSGDFFGSLRTAHRATAFVQLSNGARVEHSRMFNELLRYLN